MADFRLQIVTSQHTVFDENVTALTLPGEDGYFGVLANHAPIVSVLKTGKVTIRRGAREDEVEISKGFLEMSNNVATLLAEELHGMEGVSGAELGQRDGDDE